MKVQDKKFNKLKEYFVDLESIKKFTKSQSKAKKSRGIKYNRDTIRKGVVLKRSIVSIISGITPIKK